MTKIRAITAAAISPPVARVISPFRLHPIAKDPAHQPTCGDHQTRPRLANASSIFTAAARARYFSLDNASLAAINADDAAFLPLIALE
jgi:hypothetical protein